jgi:AcrR family transcriptional regulator
MSGAGTLCGQPYYRVRVSSAGARGAPGPSGSGPDFRRRLLDGMAAALRERGYRETTIADVVRHARTSRRTFYEHFSGKQDCFVALLRETNADTIERIRTAVEPDAPWPTQVRQAIESWIGTVLLDPTITLSWIRDVPALGDEARQLQRDTMEDFVALLQALTDTQGFESVGVRPPSRGLAIVLLGGLRELIATTVEDGGDPAAITELAVETATVVLGPRGAA